MAALVNVLEPTGDVSRQEDHVLLPPVLLALYHLALSGASLLLLLSTILLVLMVQILNTLQAARRRWLWRQALACVRC